MEFWHKLGGNIWCSSDIVVAGDLNSVSHVPHTMPAWGIAFQFSVSVIAAAVVVVVVQFSLFRYLRFFN